MIKIVEAKGLHEYVIHIVFSDGSSGDYDVGPLLKRSTALTTPLRDRDQFNRFFLELGALCWPNGFELSAGAIRNELIDQHKLLEPTKAA